MVPHCACLCLDRAAASLGTPVLGLGVWSRRFPPDGSLVEECTDCTFQLVVGFDHSYASMGVLGVQEAEQVVEGFNDGVLPSVGEVVIPGVPGIAIRHQHEGIVPIFVRQQIVEVDRNSFAWTSSAISGSPPDLAFDF